MLFNPTTSKWIHFGQMGYEDYTKHKVVKIFKKEIRDLNFLINTLQHLRHTIYYGNCKKLNL